MAEKLSEMLDEEQYTTKCLADNTIKVNCRRPDYRKLITFLKGNKVIYHTYQRKEEPAFRIVLKHIHHSTRIQEIQTELMKRGHRVRNIINGRHRVIKEPLNLFFINLEPSANNKEVYEINYIQNKAVFIEPPRKIRVIIQCTRCQQYGHSKTYCNRPYACVKCGGAHNTSICTKPRDTPARYALCNRDHPANYKGCEYYHSLFKPDNENNRLNIHHQIRNPKAPSTNEAATKWQHQQYNHHDIQQNNKAQAMQT
jgi:hypothetical protein